MSPRLPQRDRGGAAGDAAADDRDVGAQTLGHRRAAEDRDRLHRRLAAQPADALDVGAAGAGKELGGGVAADPALATSHADAGQRLEAVDLAASLSALRPAARRP